MLSHVNTHTLSLNKVVIAVVSFLDICCIVSGWLDAMLFFPIVEVGLGKATTAGPRVASRSASQMPTAAAVAAHFKQGAVGWPCAYTE